MFEENKQTETLSDKVAELIRRYQDLRAQNEALRNEIVALKGQNEALNVQISKLENDMAFMNLSEEDLFSQIENVLEDKQ